MSLINVFLNLIAMTLIAVGVVCYGVILLFDLVFVRSNSILMSVE